jgi:hypothetical protein
MSYSGVRRRAEMKREGVHSYRKVNLSQFSVILYSSVLCCLQYQPGFWPNISSRGPQRDYWLSLLKCDCWLVTAETRIRKESRIREHVPMSDYFESQNQTSWGSMSTSCHMKPPHRRISYTHLFNNINTITSQVVEIIATNITRMLQAIIWDHRRRG